MRRSDRVALIAFIALSLVLAFLGVFLVYVIQYYSVSVFYAGVEDTDALASEYRLDTETPEPKDPMFDEWAPPTQEPESTVSEPKESEPKKSGQTVDRNPSVPEGMTREEEIMWHLDRVMELLAEEYDIDYNAPS